MKKIASLGDSLKKIKETKRATSERSFVIQTICETLLSPNEFKKVLGQTKNFTIEEIESIYSESKGWNVNPAALFWKLVKQKNQEIKKQLENS